MLRAVLFDMDDTLIDWSTRERDWMTHTQACLRPIHEHLTASEHSVPALELMAQTYGEQARALWDTVCGPEWRCPKHIDILGNTLRALQMNVDEMNLPELQRMYGWEVMPGVKVFQDTIEVLSTLRAQSIRIGLITNTDLPMWIRDGELKSLELLDFIEVRLTAGDVGHLKPHPAPFRRALDLLGVTPDEAIFVGDRLHDDVAGAHAAGMRAVWVRRQTTLWPDVSNGHRPPKPNATINQLRDLLDTLDLWFPGWRTVHDDQSRSV